MIRLAIALCVPPLLLAACGTTREQTSATGAGAGMATGALVAGPLGAAVGAAVGGAGGNAAGRDTR